MAAFISDASPGSARAWGRRAVVLVALMALMGYLVVRKDVAHAATTCVVLDPTMTVTIAAGDTVTLRQTAGPSVSVTSTSGAVTCSPAPNLTATTGNVDTIVVNGDPVGDEVLVLNLTGGFFSPGKTVEGTGTSEVEFTIDLGGGTGDVLIVTGSSGTDHVTFGAGPVGAFDTDADADLTIAGTESIVVNAGGGTDGVRGSGGTRVGGAGPTTLPMTIDGGSGGDTLNGGSGADTLRGGSGNDTESGGAGDDTFVEGDASINGTDKLTGGAGTDLVTYYGRSGGVALYADGVALSGQAGENDTIATDVENLTGTAYPDTIVGNGLANVIRGYGGADKLSGLANGDFIYGGDGSDTINGGYGADTLFGGSGNDTINGGWSADTLYGNGGADTITGGPGTDVVFAGFGNDRVFINDGVADTADGGDGTDCVSKDSLDTLTAFESLSC